MPKKTIPTNWWDYKPYGSIIEDTRILPFKVPIRESVINWRSTGGSNDNSELWTTSKLMSTFPKMRYIIDLTNKSESTGYYDSSDFTASGIRYEKLKTPGGGRLPSDAFIVRFFTVMDSITKQCKDDEIIGIHCSHGVNRTGYLIIRYYFENF